MALSAGVLSPSTAMAQSTGCIFDGATLTRYADAQPNSGVGTVNLAEALRCLVNINRANHRLPVLPNVYALRASSADYAAYMVRYHFFSHTSPGGSTPQTRARAWGYTPVAGHPYRVGENLAWGIGTAATPRAIITSWLNSPQHKANVLDPGLRDIGVGAALGSPTTTQFANSATYVALFGIR